MVWTLQTVLYQVVMPGIVLYIFYRLFQFSLTYRGWIAASNNFTPIGPIHWFWGSLKLFSDYESYVKLSLDLVQRTRTKVYTSWAMFLYPVFAVCHPDSIKAVLKSSAPKPKENVGGGYRMIMPWIGDGLLVSNGKKWERNRKLLTPAFHFDILKPYMREYNLVADDFLKNLEKGTSGGWNVEIYNLVSLATLDTMLRCALSYEDQVQGKGEEHPYVVAVKRLARLITLRTVKPWHYPDFIYNLTESGREYKQLCDYVHEFTDKIIASRKKALNDDPSLLRKRRKDFLDILITAKDESGVSLSDQDIRAEVDTFLFEGHDTTASAISWAIYALGRYPEEQEIVHEEIKSIMSKKNYIDWDGVHNTKLLTTFIKEVMRMFSPVPVIGRYLTEPLHVEGVGVIPANFSVDVNIHAMNHHPDNWADHEQFRPQRFQDESAMDNRDPFSYVPFSAGSRNCIGQNFALNEQRVILCRLIRRYKVRLVPDHDYAILPEVVTRAKHGIKVFLDER